MAKQPLHDDDAVLRDIMQIIRELVAVLTQSARAVEEHTGVTNAQLFVLQQLEGHPALSINEIAALALTHQSTASLVVSRLERAGLVQRTRSNLDARRSQVSLTAAGQALVLTAPPAPTRQLLTALHALPRAEARRLCEGLQSLARVMGLANTESAMLFEPLTSIKRRRSRA